MAPALVVMNVQMLEVLRVNFSDSECSWAELNSLDVCATPCSDVVKVVLARLNVVNHQAVAMLPGFLHLVVAEPGIPVQRAFFIFLIEARNVLPAGVVRVVSHNALMGKVVEVTRENGFD